MKCKPRRQERFPCTGCGLVCVCSVLRCEMLELGECWVVAKCQVCGEASMHMIMGHIRTCKTLEKRKRRMK